jgi:hypothetical protein
MEVFDKDGNAIEGVFSQEELDAKLKETADELTTKHEESLLTANEAAVAKYKEENPPKVEEKKEEEGEKKEDEPPAWAKSLIEANEATKARVDSLTGNQNQSHLEGVTKMLDADKAKEVSERFDSMTGYEDTKEGLSRRAEDAYLLVVGEKPDSGGVNMGNINAGGTGQAPVTTGKESSADDKQLRGVLGITDADVEKFGNKENK